MIQAKEHKVQILKFQPPRYILSGWMTVLHVKRMGQSLPQQERKKTKQKKTPMKAYCIGLSFLEKFQIPFTVHRSEKVGGNAANFSTITRHPQQPHWLCIPPGWQGHSVASF